MLVLFGLFVMVFAFLDLADKWNVFSFLTTDPIHLVLIAFTGLVFFVFGSVIEHAFYK